MAGAVRYSAFASHPLVSGLDDSWWNESRETRKRMRAQGGLGAAEVHGGEPEDGGGSIGRGLCPRAEESPARDFVVGSKGEPRGEVTFAGPAAHVGSHLGDEA